MKKTIMFSLVAMIALAGVVNAGSLNGQFDGNVTVTKTGITKDGGTGTIVNSAMPHAFDGDVFIMPGGSITIEAGVIFKSVANDFADGSLIITRGAKVYINGTAQEPVIMTSTNDDLVTWRPVCREWGSFVVMGNGYISSYVYKDSPKSWDGNPNTACPGDNKRVMEGLIAEGGVGTWDPKVYYGGTNDDDCSGSIKYLSLRYGGRDIEPDNELNGMSLGAVCRGTDVSYIEIMNNVDDGIEMWGGTVNIDHVSIWNVGDDSLDFDQGWRGCAKYGLIVQGYCNDDKQGSGVGDNCFEHDGAEDSDAQPVTTAKISKFTAVGNPGGTYAGGDHGTAWRDNARVQYDRCVWMDLGEQLVKFDDSDGDGANGYSGIEGTPNNDGNGSKDTTGDGTLSWNQHWTTTYNQWITMDESNPNDCVIDFCAIYGRWMCTNPSAPLCQITNSVFYNNTNGSAYDEYNHVTGLAAGNNPGNVTASNSPIRKIEREAFDLIDAGDTTKDYTIQKVTFIDPLPANDAMAKSAGGFDGCNNWLVPWTAAYAYGFTAPSADLNCDGVVDLKDQAVVSTQWLE